MIFQKIYKIFISLFVSLLMTAIFFTGCNSSTPTLHIFTWSDLFKPDLITQFEKEFNCKVIVDIYDSNESMYAKLKLSSTHYDIIFPSNYYIQILQNQQMLQAIDTEKVPNIQNLDPTYFTMTNPLVSVPYIISFSGIAYRKDKVTLDNPSWDVFSRTDLKGRMTMLNDLREAIGAALKYLGYSVNSHSPTQVAEAGNVLLGWKKNLAKFESEQYKHGLDSGEFAVVQAYSIDIVQVINENPEVAFAYPKEGTIMSIDTMAIPIGAANSDLAHAFINFMLDPSVAEENVLFTNSLVPVLPMYERLSESKRQDPILFPSPEELKKMELIEDLQEHIEPYYKVWDKVKA